MVVVEIVVVIVGKEDIFKDKKKQIQIQMTLLSFLKALTSGLHSLLALDRRRRLQDATHSQKTGQTGLT